jgi:hypothetical protein
MICSGVHRHLNRLPSMGPRGAWSVGRARERRAGRVGEFESLRRGYVLTGNAVVQDPNQDTKRGNHADAGLTTCKRAVKGGTQTKLNSTGADPALFNLRMSSSTSTPCRRRNSTSTTHFPTFCDRPFRRPKCYRQMCRPPFGRIHVKKPPPPIDAKKYCMGSCATSIVHVWTFGVFVWDGTLGRQRHEDHPQHW